MITKVSLLVIPKVNTVQNKSVSFGFAKLNDIGRATADSFGYQHNDFLDADMFRKQGFLRKSMLASKLSQGENFTDICQTYGCTSNSKTNAEFIVNQILSSKASSALKKVSESELSSGLTTLYAFNYDNPELSLKNTKMLLEKIKKLMPPEEYIKHVGLLQGGAIK